MKMHFSQILVASAMFSQINCQETFETLFRNDQQTLDLIQLQNAIGDFIENREDQNMKFDLNQIKENGEIHNYVDLLLQNVGVKNK